MGEDSKSGSIGIQWKVFFFLLGFCFLLLIVLWMFQTVFLDGFYKNIKLREIETEAVAIAQLIEDEDYQGLLDKVTERGDLYVEVWSEERGAVLYTGNYPHGIQARMTNAYKRRLYNEAMRMEEADIKRFFTTMKTRNQQESILYSKYIEDSDGAGQLLMVSANISPVSATVETLRIQLFYISGVMLVLSVGLAYLIARWVSAPIKKLGSAARELGSGKNGVVFHGEGYREIVQLADALNHAARELADTDRLRQELIANVSHDLRTPLTLITGYGEMIRDLPDENTVENMQVIIDESKRLTSLVTDLLDLSRLQSGTGRMNFTRFNLTQDVRGIIGRFARLCEQEGYVITFEQDEDVWVSADPERIAQVVYNFLINAITHTGDDKRVAVRQVTCEGRATIQVADTGNGIPQDQLSNIWDRYYKVDEVHKRAAAGTGLGLSIVRSILDCHPGVEYGVESRPGEGSMFWFSLDRA